MPARVRPRSRCAACDRVAPELVAVGLEHAGERAEVGGGSLVEDADRGAELEHVGHAPAQDVDRGDEAGLEGECRVDRVERGVDRAGVERRVDDGRDQRLLVGEDAEDRALGDAGRLGDLAGGERGAVGEQQRERGLDDAGPALLGWERGRRAREVSRVPVAVRAVVTDGKI